MKVLTICDVLFPHTVGGAGRFAREVAEALQRQGVEVEFLTRRVPSQFKETIHSEHLPPMWQTPLGAFPRTLAQQVQRFRPDIIHSHQPLPTYLTRAWSHPIPMVHTFHSSWPEEFRIKSSPWPAGFRAPLAGLYTRIERQVVEAATAVTVLSEFSKSQVQTFYGRSAVIIPGGVNVERFRPVDAARSAGRVHLITVRNLVPRMGLDSLVRAMALLPADVHLTIGGQGPLKGELQALAQQLHLTGRVRLAGHIPDDELPGFYCSGDWFVLPTAALEGFGLVILESLSCGTPVLGTRVGAIPDVLGQFDPGWIMEQSTPESIAAGVMRAMATRPPDRLQLHESVAAEFSWDRIGARYAALFQSLISR